MSTRGYRKVVVYLAQSRRWIGQRLDRLTEWLAARGVEEPESPEDRYWAQVYKLAPVEMTPELEAIVAQAHARKPANV